jgi:hypothetical protein
VNDLKKGKSFEQLKDLLEEGLKEPWDQCSLGYCQEKLREIDVQSGVWMDEDGGPSYYSSVSSRKLSEPIDAEGKVVRAKLSFTPLDTGVCQSVTLTFRGAISRTVCIATSGHDTWFLSGNPVEKLSELEEERYELERVPEGRTNTNEVFHACFLKVDSLTFV